MQVESQEAASPAGAAGAAGAGAAAPTVGGGAATGAAAGAAAAAFACSATRVTAPVSAPTLCFNASIWARRAAASTSPIPALRDVPVGGCCTGSCCPPGAEFVVANTAGAPGLVTYTTSGPAAVVVVEWYTKKAPRRASPMAGKNRAFSKKG